MTILPQPPIAGDIVIDVSHWEGVIDWPRVKAAGINKAVIKLTDGRNFGDPLAGYNARSGREAGVTILLYHYLRPNIDPLDQMAVFFAALYGVYWKPDEGVVLDIEATGGLYASRLRTHILASYKLCLTRLEVVPEIYTRMSFWKAAVAPINWEALMLPTPPLYAADYGYNGSGSGIREPRWIAGSGWKTWRRWQYTDRGRVDGIDAAVDLNVER